MILQVNLFLFYTYNSRQIVESEINFQRYLSVFMRVNLFYPFERWLQSHTYQ